VLVAECVSVDSGALSRACAAVPGERRWEIWGVRLLPWWSFQAEGSVRKVPDAGPWSRKYYWRLPWAGQRHCPVTLVLILREQTDIGPESG
jgi:hypothetical protein